LRKIKPMPQNTSHLAPASGTEHLSSIPGTDRAGTFHQSVARVKTGAKAAALGLTIALGATVAHTDDTRSDNVVLASAENGASSDAQGGGIDNSSEQAAIDAKIQELEAKGLDALTDAEFDLLFEYQDQLVALENQTQEEQAVAIEAEKSETAAQEATIKAENEKQAKNKQKIADEFDEIKSAVEG